MIKQNIIEFTRCRITDYHAAGIIGEGKTIAILDDGGKPFDFMTYCECPLGCNAKGGHATSVARVAHEVAPGAKVICLPYTHLSYTEKEKSIKWLLENPPDIINCSFSGGALTVI